MGKTTVDYLRTIYKLDAQQWFDFMLRCKIENHYGGIFYIINLFFSKFTISSHPISNRALALCEVHRGIWLGRK